MSEGGKGVGVLGDGEGERRGSTRSSPFIVRPRSSHSRGFPFRVRGTWLDYKSGLQSHASLFHSPPSSLNSLSTIHNTFIVKLIVTIIMKTITVVVLRKLTL